MGKLTGGPFGIIRGKTGNMNFKYSGGKNIISQYVPNPRNPNTPAQIKARDIFKQKTYPFTNVDDIYWKGACGMKNLSTPVFTKMPGMLKNPTIPFEASVPAKSWVLHAWRVLVDTFRGQERHINELPNPWLKASWIFDRINLRGDQIPTIPTIFNVWTTDQNGKLRNTLGFSHNQELFPTGQVLLGTNVWLCHYADQYSDPDTGEWSAQEVTCLNVGGMGFHGQIPIGLSSKFDPFFINTITPPPIMSELHIRAATIGNLILQSALHSTNICISCALNCGTRMQGNITKYIEDIENVEIIQDWYLALSDIVFECVYSNEQISFTAEYVGTIPEKYTHNSFMVVLQIADATMDVYKSLTIYNSELNSRIVTDTLNFWNIHRPLNAMIQIVIDEQYASQPMRIKQKFSSTKTFAEENYAFYNDSLFRNRSISSQANMICRLALSATGGFTPHTNLTWTLKNTAKDTIGTGVTGDLGILFFKTEIGVQVNELILTSGINSMHIPLNIYILPNSEINLGTIMFVAE